VIFANDFTAAPYTAISDGEVRESNLIELILAGELPEDGEQLSTAAPKGRIEDARREILAEVVAGVRASAAPVPLEALADRALRALGHEKTIATGWAGAGSFRELLRRNLPEEIRLTGEPPYLAFDAKRHLDEPAPRVALEARDIAAEIAAPQMAALASEPLPHLEPAPRASQAQAARPAAAAAAAAKRPAIESPLAPSYRPAPLQQETVAPQRTEAAAPSPRAAALQQPAAPAPQRSEGPSAIQQSIARIQEACQAPPLAPPEYRLLFEIMAKEINDNDLIGAQTLTNITQRAQERGLDVRRDDVRFVLEVVSEADPWFEQGASANLFAGRFRNFVVARCRGQGLNLSADELDLIDAWFAGGTLPQSMAAPKVGAAQPAPAIAAPAAPAQAPQPAAATEGRASRWWSLDDGRSHNLEPRTATPTAAPAGGANGDQAEEFPRIVRTRLRG